MYKLRYNAMFNYVLRIMFCFSYYMWGSCWSAFFAGNSVLSVFYRDDDDEEDGAKAAARQNNTSMLSYLSRNKPDELTHSRDTHRFFTERKLQSISNLWMLCTNKPIKTMFLVLLFLVLFSFCKLNKGQIFSCLLF